jgi:hypothetical protein
MMRKIIKVAIATIAIVTATIAIAIVTSAISMATMEAICSPKVILLK